MNRVFERRGRVLDGRSHHRLLRTPKEVRRALAYVLLKTRHHYYERHRKPRPDVRLDPVSSAIWFESWKPRPPPHLTPVQPDLRKEVAPAATSLLAKGWRRRYLIDPAEIPGH